GDTLRFTWSLETPAGSTASLKGKTGSTNTFPADVVGSYTVTVLVDDGELEATTSATVTVLEELVINQAPVADAGEPVTLHVGDKVLLAGTGSSDPEGDDLTYSWTFLSRPEGSAARFDEASAPSPSFTADVVGRYLVALVVNDGELDSAAAQVQIDATNTDPVVETGANRSGHPGTPIELIAVASDADRDPLSVAWEVVSQPQGAAPQLTVTDALATSLIADLPGAYTVEVRVRDAFGGGATDRLMVTVENRAPMVSAGSDAAGIVGQAVALVATASDADGHALTYQWSVVSRPGQGAVTIAHADRLQASFVPPVEGVFTLRFMVTDGFATAFDEVSVVVTAATVNRPPVADAGADSVINLASGATIALSGAGSTDPEGETLTYRWSIVSRPAQSTATLTANGAVASLVPDAAGTWVFSLEVSDGELTSTDRVTVRVNTPPVAPCLVISEYVEGSGFNKAIELFNCGTQPLDLAGYQVCLSTNGAANCGQSMTLSGSLPAGEVFVACHPQIGGAGSAACDVSNISVINFNGNDGIRLREAGSGVVVDAFGSFTGTDPGNHWVDRTLRRECSLAPYLETSDFTDSAVWGLYYRQYPKDDVSNLGLPPNVGTCP
ncbi:MAG: PKD domain-containing protein, partial [Myxococcaceae bacterium]